MPNTVSTTAWGIHTANILLYRETDGAAAVFVSLESPDEADIVKYGRVRREDMPPRWYAVENLNRNLDYWGAADLRKFVLSMTKMLLGLTGGVPIVWQCSRAHAQAYVLIFGDRLAVVAGSMVGRPFYDAEFGGDEQVVMLREYGSD